jgi:hypothetical protein
MNETEHDMTWQIRHWWFINLGRGGGTNILMITEICIMNINSKTHAFIIPGSLQVLHFNVYCIRKNVTS